MPPPVVERQSARDPRNAQVDDGYTGLLELATKVSEFLARSGVFRSNRRDAKIESIAVDCPGNLQHAVLIAAVRKTVENAQDCELVAGHSAKRSGYARSSDSA